MTVAVGFFDGVHLGHRAILSGADVALTFRNHPLSVVAPERAPRLLMDFDSRVAAIRACGVREVRAFDFTPEFARLLPAEFLAEAGISRETEVRCGSNWRFGRGGEGDAEWLRARGYRVTVVPSVSYRGEGVSSTRIRAGRWRTRTRCWGVRSPPPAFHSPARARGRALAAPPSTCGSTRRG